MSHKHVFTPIEKQSFVDILKTFGHIIENKNTDGSNLRAKNEAWERVTREYNANPNTTREVTNKQFNTNTRRLWMNLKQRQRDALVKERQHRVATGGGPATLDVFIDPDIMQITPALIVGIDEAIDSDTLTETNQLFEEAKYNFPSSSFGKLQPPQPVSWTLSAPTPTVITSLTPPTVITSSTAPTVVTPRPNVIVSPPTVTNPPPPTTPPPASSTSAVRSKGHILSMQYRDRQKRAEELHELEKELLKAKKREAIAKAELAELLLENQKSILKE